MTDEQLQRLAALAEAATPARWIAEQGMGVRLADYTPICMSSVTGEPVNVDANMAFIAAARQAVPELLAEAAALRRQLEHANRWRDVAIVEANEARAEAADLRRQLAEVQAEIAAFVPMRAAANAAIAEAADLRRQLAEVQAEIAAVPRPEIGELCDLIGNSTTAISLDCPAGWAVREWLETYDAADLRRQFEQERVEIGMLRRQLQEGEQAALSHAIGQIFHLRRQLAECQEIAAARGESLGYETADEWNDNPATDANDARQEAAKLRRQLDRERIAAIQHAIWSHWMTYQFSVCLRNDDGTMTIPAQKVMRWERQAATPYAELSEAERESDRHQADRILVAAVTPHRAGKGDE